MTSAYVLATETEQVTAATGVFSLMWLIIALPLLGALVLLVGGNRTNRWGPIVATLLPIGSFVLAAAMFATMVSEPSEGRAVEQILYSWVPVGELQVYVGFLLDQLSVVFLLLITFVGSLIHLYSLGYMKHDPEIRRFFAYLNLFVASMLLLVLANSYLLLYVGWEGVGLASYLLIGFWQYKPTAATAAKKAFVINRVGDLGLSIAVMVMFVTFGSVSFSGVFGQVSQASSGTVDLLGLLLLLAACGKSAQVPLQAWLLDAMEGPTPVSALIHAATMVTAGVYLIARSHPIFNISSLALTAVAIVGVVTLAFGAIIGCAMDDIKKALAASTMSQIGYMVLAVGLGTTGYSLGIGHLLSHGFFKAGLFLAAGSVMHAMRDQLDIRRYGGLRKAMPITFVTFFLAYLAIIGIPPFSGFFTKDPIIDAAYHSGGTSGIVYGLVAQLTAGLTAFYMTRVVILTFFGPKRWHEDDKPHESPATMTVPMVVLAFGSVFLGGYLMLNNRLITFLEPVLGEAEPAQYLSALTFVTLALVLAGVGVAWWMYQRQEVPQTAPVGSGITVAARNSLYGDSFNETVFMRPGQYLTRSLVYFDNRIIDGFVNGFAAVVGGLSSRSRRLQSGFARSYALTMLLGALFIVLALVLVRL